MKTIYIERSTGSARDGTWTKELSMEGVTYRAAHKSEWDICMDLAWRTFLKYEAPGYTDEGVKNFNAANMVIEKNRCKQVLLEHLADMVIFSIGMMRHLGEEDVEGVIRRRIGK